MASVTTVGKHSSSWHNTAFCSLPWFDEGAACNEDGGNPLVQVLLKVCVGEAVPVANERDVLWAGRLNTQHALGTRDARSHAGVHAWEWLETYVVRQPCCGSPMCMHRQETDVQ